MGRSWELDPSLGFVINSEVKMEILNLEIISGMNFCGVWGEFDNGSKVQIDCVCDYNVIQDQSLNFGFLSFIRKRWA